MAESNLKPKADCEGDRDRCTLGAECPKFGTLGRVARDGKRRVAGCGRGGTVADMIAMAIVWLALFSVGLLIGMGMK